MGRYSLNILRVVSKKRFEKSSLNKKIEFDLYKKVMMRLSELLGEEIINNEEGLFIPSLGIFKVTKNKITKNKIMRDKTGKPYYNFHSAGYIFGIKFFPEKTLPNKYLYKFNANRTGINNRLGIKQKLANRIFDGYTNYSIIEYGVRK